MNKYRALIIALAAFILGLVGNAVATDLPHTNNCQNCHAFHGTQGQDLTKLGTIAEVCISCHNNSGLASGKPLSSGMQAVPGVSGTSHRWDASMDCVATPSKCGPGSQFGLRKPAADINNPQADEIQSYEMNFELIDTNYVVTCSVCHDAHFQTASSWNPDNEDAGTADGGSTSTVSDATKNWNTDQWAGYSLELTSGPNTGERRRIGTNSATELTIYILETDPLYQSFPVAVGSGDTYVIYGGEFMIEDNYINETDKIDSLNRLCEDCHYYRTPDAGQQNVTVYDGNVKSHPTIKVFSSASGETPDVSLPATFNAAPLEPSGASWAQQTNQAATGNRYHLNGGTDTNNSNNIVLDRNGKIRCLSCHSIHYADSDSSTVDGP